MNEFVKILKNKPGFVHMAPASEVSINEAEKQIVAKFSDDFRAYLSAYGCASWAGHELTGISDYDQINVVRITLEERTLNPKIPSDLYVIEQTHIDDIVVWQDGSGQVYYSQPKRPPVQRFASLLEYISQ
ncbi:MAG: SMI1/KNR4 family protein [Clostridiales bacterium]|nr:SMI1/KNR4 family protein [Clostridiales bacterium]